MKSNLENICKQFKHKDEILDIFAFGTGHIHNTYKVEGKKHNYILQRINHHIFKDIEGLTENIVKISKYLQKKRLSEPMQNLIPIPLVGLGHVYYDLEKNAWRMFHFIENSHTYDKVTNTEIALEGGRAFGGFLVALKNFNADNLVETIPGFHHIGFRLDRFLRSIENDVCYRVEFVPKEIELIFDRAQEMRKLDPLIEKGLIPKRVVHNDTKVNNLLFNKEERAICVIDLDTLMPGYAIFDFGDAIRTFANHCNEDEKDLSKIELSMENFAAFTQGYLGETKSLLTQEEIDNLAFAAKYITFEQSLRFLLDYIEGDWYYKVDYPDHNLIRARAQMQLLKSMEAHFSEMQRLVRSFS